VNYGIGKWFLIGFYKLEKTLTDSSGRLHSDYLLDEIAICNLYIILMSNIIAKYCFLHLILEYYRVLGLAR
jgi:hypothetical protein